MDFETARGMLVRLHSAEAVIPVSRGTAEWLAQGERLRALERDLGAQLSEAVARQTHRLFLEG